MPNVRKQNFPLQFGKVGVRYLFTYICNRRLMSDSMGSQMIGKNGDIFIDFIFQIYKELDCIIDKLPCALWKEGLESNMPNIVRLSVIRDERHCQMVVRTAQDEYRWNGMYNVGCLPAPYLS